MKHNCICVLKCNAENVLLWHKYMHVDVDVCTTHQLFIDDTYPKLFRTPIRCCFSKLMSGRLAAVLLPEFWPVRFGQLGIMYLTRLMQLRHLFQKIISTCSVCWMI